MGNVITKYIVNLLRNCADNIENNTCELNEEEQHLIMSVLAHRVMSKEQAYDYCKIQRSRFDELVRNNKLPKGRKRKGFKELVWYEDELYTAMSILKDN